MQHPLVPTPLQPERLITPEEARAILTDGNSDYGAHFSEEEWSRIAERISALARLLWRISCRKARSKPNSPVDPTASRLRDAASPRQREPRLR